MFFTGLLAFFCIKKALFIQSSDINFDSNSIENPLDAGFLVVLNPPILKV
jgi:hypothetical protein|tara:strand:- start:319 stop:468 length:150 start_codon:yes stop_codon:yes gene_type:complete